jgi:uncharacterized protein with HEPN domain
VSQVERQRLSDIQAALEAIHSHLECGDLSDGLIFDAVRIRLLEIGEAVKALPAELLASEPTIPWAQVARMRDHLAHRYFDTSHSILQATVDHDLPDLELAVNNLIRRLLTALLPTTPKRTGAANRSMGLFTPGWSGFGIGT